MLLFFLLLFFALPLYTVLSGQAPLNRDFRTADRSSAGIAPRADTTPEAVVQVYYARALNWRGIFGVHTWIATKPENAREYTVHQVIGWRLFRGMLAVVSAPGTPDGRWFGNEPTLIADLRRRGCAGHSEDPRRRGELSLPGRIQSVAGPQQQYVCRLHRTPSARAAHGSSGDRDRQGLSDQWFAG